MSRTFTIDNSCINVAGGKYMSGTPISAAKKAAVKLFENAKESPKYKNLRKITFCLRETTVGSKKKMYDYKASRVKVDRNYKIEVVALKNKHIGKPVPRRSKKSKGGCS